MFSVRRSGFFLCLMVCTLSLRAQSTTPALSQPLPAQLIAPGGAAVAIDLRNYFALPGVTGQVAQVDTVLGRFNIELLANDAPLTVANFLSYVNRGAYANTLVHRLAPGFVIQSGGYSATSPFAHIAVAAPVLNEFKLSNLRGTLAMAKIGPAPGTDPTPATINSATSEWFVNLTDNSANLNNQNGGFTVFARVLGSGMNVVDNIAALQFYNAGSPFDSIPLRDVASGQQDITLANLIIVNNVTVVPIYPPAGGGAAVLSFIANSSNAAVVTASLDGATLRLTPGTAGNATVNILATDTNGNTTSGSFSVSVAAAPSVPVITTQPVPAITMVSGTSNTVVFTVAATGAPAPSYQWKRNGTDVTGKTTATYVLTNASDAQAGTFTCVVTNSQGSITSQPSVLTFAPAANPGRVINLSVLTALAAGENMTMGTVLGGAGTSGNKPLLARAAGPSLAQLGVNGYLPDPTMALNYTTPSPAVLVATNDDWNGTAVLSNAFVSVGAFSYAAANSKDAALFQSGPTALVPGNYTVKVSDAGSGTGTVIAELYDATASSAVTATTPRLINVSVLKQIAAGGSLTAGFVIGGTTGKTVLVRAIGPGLSQFGVGNLMSDPQLALFQGQTKIADNDNWNGDSQLTQVGGAVGAFNVPDAASKDAMVLITLQPGANSNFTAQVGGVGGVGGNVLVEVYEVP